MRKTILPFLLLGLLFLGSCEKEDTVSLSDLEAGHSFYPLAIGNYVVYDVDSIVWNDTLQAAIPTQCQLRYNVADTFRDDAGNLSYTINVLYRRTAADAYVPNSVIHATVQNNQLRITEHHRTFIKLVFPVTEGKSWDGNALIETREKSNAEYTNYNWNYVYTNYNWNYVYSNFDQVLDGGTDIFPHTVTVNEINDQLNDPDVDSSLDAYKNYAQEIYAYGVGLVYSERIYWVYHPDAAPNGETPYRKGYSIIMKAVDHN